MWERFLWWLPVLLLLHQCIEAFAGARLSVPSQLCQITSLGGLSLLPDHVSPWMWSLPLQILGNCLIHGKVRKHYCFWRESMLAQSPSVNVVSQEQGTCTLCNTWASKHLKMELKCRYKWLEHMHRALFCLSNLNITAAFHSFGDLHVLNLLQATTFAWSIFSVLETVWWWL